MLIVSKCLAGVPCRYDGKDNRVPEIKALVERGEAVAVRPRRVLRVDVEVLEPEYGRDVGHAHRSAGVARLCLLDDVRAEAADGVCRELEDFLSEFHFRFFLVFFCLVVGPA